MCWVRILIFILSVSSWIVPLGFAQSLIKNSPLALTIKSDKDTYTPGEEIKITYFIKNEGSVATGFYVGENSSVIKVFNKAGREYESYFDPSAQRAMPFLYPAEYILLQPGEQWTHSENLKLMKGNITSYRGTKMTPEVYNVYTGFFIDCQENCRGYDSILLSGFSGGEIKISAKYETGDPNPRNFKKSDCKEANISIDSYLDGNKPNQIIYGAKCEGGACPDWNSSLYNPMDEERISNLAIFCQQNSTLTKVAWIGTLDSNMIAIKVAEKRIKE